MALTLFTTFGDLKLELFCDQAPLACENFLALCASGYYNGTIFHRNIKGFMVQGGDPTGTGKGGKSIFATPNGKFPDEISDVLKHSKRGILSMANSGPNTNGSQFFITYKAHSHLNGKYTVFGHVIDGLDTLDRMEKIPSDAKDRPKQEIKIERAQGASVNMCAYYAAASNTMMSVGPCLLPIYDNKSIHATSGYVSLNS